MSTPPPASSASPGPVRVTLQPEGVREWIGDAIVAGGGTLVAPEEADVLVWAETAAPAALDDLLHGAASGVKWVQLPWAGIEPYVPVLDTDRVWTCAKGVYAGPVAEHALTLLLAGLRGLGQYARAREWTGPRGTNLIPAPNGANVVVLGGGGITEWFLRLIAPFDADVTVVRRHPQPMPGAARVVGLDELDDVLDGAIGVVLALALTPETTGVMHRARLERMHERGWLVNVARGAHVVTDDLVDVLRAERIGGAALDVTDPEPLPPDHPLWSMDNCIITPHVGNTPEMALPLLAARISENLRRWAAGEPLLGLVDARLGY